MIATRGPPPPAPAPPSNPPVPPPARTQFPQVTARSMLEFLDQQAQGETISLEYQVHLQDGIRHLTHNQLKQLRNSSGKDEGGKEYFNPRRVKRITKKVEREIVLVWSEMDPRNRWSSVC